MNENFEKYIKDLSPEMQEKARACKTKDELLELAADEDMEIPMDALESVAGGCGGGWLPDGGPRGGGRVGGEGVCGGADRLHGDRGRSRARARGRAEDGADVSGGD